MQINKQIAKLNVGAAIRVEGIVVATPEMKQPFEIKAEKIEATAEEVAAEEVFED